MTVPDWNTMLTFAAGVFATLATVLSSRPSRKADAQKGDATLSEATMKWATGLREEIDRLREEMDENEERNDREMARLTRRLSMLEVENHRFRRHNALLIGQLTDAGITPVAPPDPPPRDD